MKYLMLVLLTISTSAFAKNLTQLSSERVIFHTNIGDIAVALYPKAAPKHVAQILRMVKAGAYDGVPIGRIEKGFVAQVYNYDARMTPLTDKQRATISKIPAEFTSIPHTRGVLSMAREDKDINSGEFSFSFLLGDAPHLNGQYTVFGQVIDGMDVLAAIENIAAVGTAPTVPVTVERAEIVDAGQLSQMQLKTTPTVPFDKSKVLFEIFAGLMFFFTVSTPIYKSMSQKRSA